MQHNCNNFSDEIAQFLCGTGIPKYILDLPNEVLQTRLGPALQALVGRLERSARPLVEEGRNSSNQVQKESSPDLEQLNSQIEEARSEYSYSNDSIKKNNH